MYCQKVKIQIKIIVYTNLLKKKSIVTKTVAETWVDYKKAFAITKPGELTGLFLSFHLLNKLLIKNNDTR